MGANSDRWLVHQPLQRTLHSALDVPIARTPDLPQLPGDTLQEDVTLVDRQGRGRGHDNLQLTVTERDHRRRHLLVPACRRRYRARRAA